VRDRHRVEVLDAGDHQAPKTSVFSRAAINGG
jgi:hypothetical protein